jgi:arylsulfatase A-like enzyme
MLRAGFEPNDRQPGQLDEMVWISGGTFRMGSNDHYPEEAPVHRVAVDGFWIDRTPVTNRQFKQFVKATGHVTTAQIPPDPKDYPAADGGTSPFRSEKTTNWEGEYRVPCMIRWPGKIAPGSVSNEIFSSLDWVPTLMAAASEPDIKNKLLTGYDAVGRTFKVHLDGYNQLPHLTGQQDRGARKEFIYFNDDGDLVALRYENWKLVFEEQRAPGTLRVWAEPFTKLRLPKLFDLRADPYERADITSNTYYDWLLAQGYVIVAAQAVVGQFLASFKEYPPSQRAQSFSIDQIVEKMQKSLEAM